MQIICFIVNIDYAVFFIKYRNFRMTFNLYIFLYFSSFSISIIVAFNCCKIITELEKIMENSSK